MSSRLTFTPGNHAYWLLDPDTGKKQRLPSVTTLLNQLGKPALVKWAAREAADYSVDHWAELSSMPPSERAKLIAGAADRKKTSTAARGTQIHAWAEQLLAGQPVQIPDQHRSAVEGLARWWDRSGWESLFTEALVWSDDDEYGGCAYAGRLDLIASDHDTRSVLADIKTGSGIWPEMAVQLAAYAAADTIVINGQDVENPRMQRLCLLHVRPDGTTLHEVPPDQRRVAEERFTLLRALRAIDEPAIEEKDGAAA